VLIERTPEFSLNSGYIVERIRIGHSMKNLNRRPFFLFPFFRSTALWPETISIENCRQ
jgi:hypothetical protein